MYESPINMIISEFCTNLENDCLKSVQRFGFDVDKEELAKALKYDREQYEKGYADGYKKALDDFADKAQKECDIQNWSKNYGISFENLEKISEQLKEGGNINE